MSENIGAADAGRQPSAAEAPAQPRIRHLQRVREGQRVAGVCTGIADYAELPVDWVRTFFVLATLGTAGLFGFVYVALAVILPITATRTA